VQSGELSGTTPLTHSDTSFFDCHLVPFRMRAPGGIPLPVENCLNRFNAQKGADPRRFIIETPS